MKKYSTKFLLSILLMAAVSIIIYMVFKDSRAEIQEQLLHADRKCLGVLFLFGNAYYVLDGLAYWYIIRRCGEKMGLAECIRMAYMGVFFNVMTLGAGTKASQIVAMNKKGIDPGKGFGLLVMEYVTHKIAIVVCAFLSLVFFGGRMDETLAGAGGYIYAGFALSILIVGFLIWLCVSSGVHRLLVIPCRKFIKRQTWLKKIDELEGQLMMLRSVSLKFSEDIRGWLILVGISMFKMQFWYGMPCIAYRAVTGNAVLKDSITGLSLSAVMQLLIGVLPGVGGTGSTEVAYTFIYSGIFGVTQTASTMLLYRCFNYYIPFLVSLMVLFVHCNRKKK